MNMVRAGAVKHPGEWSWCGYKELLGLRKRNRLIDQAELPRTLGDGVSFDGFRSGYDEGIQEAITRQDVKRESLWTESLAVGGRNFVEEVGGRIPNRMKVVVESMGDEGEPWIVREDQEAYG